MQKTERLVAITLLLQARGKMTAQRLANILDVSTRTIYRDIMALSLAHVPVSMELGPGGGYYLPEDYHLESAIFTREEAISLILGADMLGGYNLFAGDNDLQRALTKLEAVLPEEYSADVKAAREHILLDTSEWCSRPMPTTYLELLRAAVLGKYQLEILYPTSSCHKQASNEPLWRRIEPYGLVLRAVPRRHMRTGLWYLVAYCHACQDFNTFRVSYIEQIQVRNEPVCERPDFNLSAYWRETRSYLDQQRFTFKLRVSPAIRHNLKGDYTVKREEPDGSAIVRVEVASFDDAVSYALGLRVDATVLCPAQVREAVVATAHAIASMYGSPTPSQAPSPI